MDGWMNGWMDGWMDNYTDRHAAVAGSRREVRSPLGEARSSTQGVPPTLLSVRIVDIIFIIIVTIMFGIIIISISIIYDMVIAIIVIITIFTGFIIMWRALAQRGAAYVVSVVPSSACARAVRTFCA